MSNGYKPTTGSPGCRSGGTWPRACCTATAPTPKPSPGSPGASSSTTSASSPARSAPARPSPSGAATAALDASRHVPSTWPTPPSGSAGSCTTSSPPSAESPFYTSTLVPQAADALAGETAERGRTPVLVIDEAHLLHHEQLEAIRMLTNHDMDSGAPFAVLLIGQPTLRQRMRLGVLAALDQRIGMRYAMPAMTAPETADYITHHLTIAGRADTLFSADAVTVIHNACRGYPRGVNNLAVHALTAAYAANNAVVDEKAARAALTETATD